LYAAWRTINRKLKRRNVPEFVKMSLEVHWKFELVGTPTVITWGQIGRWPQYTAECGL